jgi:ubiquinone/menaquinone biosynthesis C-methylase UbiE
MDEERARQMKQGVAGVFNRSAPTYDQVGPRFFAYFGKRLVEAADIPAGATVLDVACGRGAVSFPAAEQVGTRGHMVAIDLADEMVNAVRDEALRRGLYQAEARVMDAERLDFPDDYFDRVLCGFAVFFFPHLQNTLAEFRRVLKPGGKLAFSTWGADDPRWLWMGELVKAHTPPTMPQPPSGPNPCNNTGGLEALMREAGFEAVQVIPNDSEFTYADEEDWWAVQWSHGARFPLEMMSPEMREQYKAQAFEKLRAMKRADGIPHLLSAFYTLAQKPV